MEKKNAKIIDTFLGYEDHRILTFQIKIEFDHCCCGVGNYQLAHTDGKKRYCYAVGLSAIAQILDVVGVDSWEDLKGEYIRVVDEGNRLAPKIIGNLMEDKWVNLEKVFSESEIKTADYNMYKDDFDYEDDDDEDDDYVDEEEDDDTNER